MHWNETNSCKRMDLRSDLSELAVHLRQERLYVNSEREQLQKLFDDVKREAEDLYHTSWISQQQRLQLKQMLFSPQSATQNCFLRINCIEGTSFVDSYKYLTYHDTKYGDFIKFLRENPQLIAHCIHVGERIDAEGSRQMVDIVLSSLYGNCILQEDEVFTLHLLKTLTELQLVSHTNPRQLLRRGSCALSYVFKHLCDSIFSVKLFLTAALHDPVMRLLMEDEWFYDIDPDKALVRFPPQERLRRFGQPGSKEYNKKLQDYRKFIVDKLVLLATRFINSIQNNFHCFPPSLNWLMSQIYQLLTDCGKFDASEIRAVCADLVFALFICPAICDPEPYGITSDVPISHISRHNLMQMANILQVLAISQYDEIDPKVKDLYSRFDKNCMTSFLDGLLQNVRTDLPACSSPQLQLSSRSSVLLPLTQLNNLVEYLKKIIPHLSDSVVLKTQLDGLVSDIQVIVVPSATSPLTPADTPTPATPTSTKKLFKSKKYPLGPSFQDNLDDSSSSLGDINDMSVIPKNPNQQEDVLVVSLGISLECPGMMSEQKVLSWEQDERREPAKFDNLLSFSTNTPVMPEKRTRFSLSNDQESIGNTSDIQEAVSEAASSHSVGSADLEADMNDNFSDMISANVSGRGTPNISGRDTPLSQAESAEEPRPSDLPETVQKNNREDVTERFGKFDIKAELEPDMKSTVSDTWSTDVLASDSEPPDQNQLERLDEVAEEMMRQNLLPINISSIEPLSELSETASDAWSTDVLASASDTEEKQADLLDFDQDDSGSIENPSSLPNMERTNSRPGSVSDQQLGSGEQDDDSSAFHFMPSSAADNSRKQKSIPDDAFSSHPHNDRFAQNHPPRHRKYLNVPKQRTGSSGSSQKSDSFTLSSQNTVDTSAHSKGPQRFTSSITIPPSTSPSILKVNGPVAAEAGDDQFDIPVPKDSKKFDLSTIQNAIDGEDKDGQEPSDDIDSFAETNCKMDQTRLSVALGMFDPLVTDDVLCDDSGSNRFANESSAKEQTENIMDMTVASCETAKSKNVDFLTENNDKKKSDLLFFEDGEEAATKRWSSSDSSHSTTSSNLYESQESVQAVGHTPSKDDEKESSDTDLTKSSEKMKKSLISSFKEKLSKSVKKKGGPKLAVLDTSQTNHQESSDEILARYRKKAQNNTPVSTAGIPDSSQRSLQEKRISIAKENEQNQAMFYDPNNVESCFAFLDAKRKLRMVLSTGEFQSSLTTVNAECDAVAQSQQDASYLYKRESEVVNFLRVQLAEATNLQNKDMIAQLHEAVRCLRMFDPDGIQVVEVLTCLILNSHYQKRLLDWSKSAIALQLTIAEGTPDYVQAEYSYGVKAARESIPATAGSCRKIVQSLRDDYHSRSSYIAYLVRCRQGLLVTLSHLQRLHNRIQRYKEISNKHLTNVCVRLFIEKHEKEVLRFISDFQRLTVSDEKTDLVEQFLDEMYSQIEKHPIWHAATDFQLEDARLALERYLMSRIYTHAMFPNGDGDILRDQLFHQHIKKLSPLITPNHKDLRIPQIYHYECPWPAAQREIYMINAYKTPKDKLQKVIRCSTTIMNLLSMANEKSVPAADDFMPVLIYVLIKANPPYLLSTIQYVTSFYEKRLAGEEQYWWMQFSSAVEFIKTMDYNR